MTTDQASANTRLLELGECFDFQTFWDPALCDGHRVMYARDLALLMFGTTSLQRLDEVLRFYDEQVYVIAMPEGHYQTFATYRHFLLAGIRGDTPVADRVVLLLLAREENQRTNDALREPSTWERLEGP